jgi:hypothetical protein
MEKFPDTFGRASCLEIMTKQQTEIIKETRKSFFDAINDLTTKCELVMELNFPDKLWYEHKYTLIGEILQKFGKIKIKIIGRPNDATLLIVNMDEVPKNSNIKKIIIEFPRD